MIHATNHLGSTTYRSIYVQQIIVATYNVKRKIKMPAVVHIHTIYVKLGKSYMCGYNKHQKIN